MDILKVALLQNDIVWEDVTANLHNCARSLASLAGKAHIAVLPEMFTTGFSMNAPAMAREGAHLTLATLQQWAAQYGMALAGSFIAGDEGRYYNRAFFITPAGETHFYDKRHLFRMGDEGRCFTAGNHRLILHYEGWNIALFVCYDLRFPVWSRNVGNEYDLALYVASWPQPRAHAWRSLLVARAIENAAYVCGVNRVGTDPAGLIYKGDTMAIDFKGITLHAAPDNTPAAIVVDLDKTKLDAFRIKFPVWCDADSFTLL